MENAKDATTPTAFEHVLRTVRQFRSLFLFALSPFRAFAISSLPSAKPARARGRSRAVVSGNRGFSLLEVIVALAVLTIGIAGVLRVFSTSMAAVHAADSQSTAASLANRVALQIDHDSSLESGTESGSFDDYKGYSWQAEIGSADDNGLMRVVISITWGDRNTPRTFDMVTYVRPTSTESDSTTTTTSSSATTGGS